MNLVGAPVVLSDARGALIEGLTLVLLHANAIYCTGLCFSACVPCYLARATVSRHHRVGGLNSRDLFSLSSRD